MSSTLESAVIDSSALMCIAKNEPTAKIFRTELVKVGKLYISAPTKAEALLAAMAAKDHVASEVMAALMIALQVETVDFKASDVSAYHQAALKYHVKATPAGLLNMGDIFSLVLAQQMNIPLFFQGFDFLATPVKNAMQILGYEMTQENKGVPHSVRTQIP